MSSKIHLRYNSCPRLVYNVCGFHITNHFAVFAPLLLSLQILKYHNSHSNSTVFEAHETA